MTCDDQQGHDAVTAVCETPAKPPKRSRRRRDLHVAPIQNTSRLTLRERWSSCPPAAGDLSGQALGLIPLVGSRLARPIRLVAMKVPD